ncbi:hypothetical protein AKJ16_DCAP27383 [Drosera capensis]
MNRTFSRRRNVKENLCSYPPTWLVSSTYAAAAADFSPSIQPPHPPSISLNRRLPLTLLCLHISWIRTVFLLGKPVMDHKGNELASSLNAENKDNAVEITCYTDFVGGCNSTFSNNSPSKSEKMTQKRGALLADDVVPSITQMRGYK